MNVKGKKTERSFQGQALVALVELGRLLCCNGRKMRAFLHRFRSEVFEKRATEGDEPIPFSDAKTYTHELERYKIQENVRRRWETGAVGVHAIKLNWWRSDEARTKDYLVGRPKSKRETATLLVIANRGSDTPYCRVDQREEEIFFAVLPENIGDDEVSAIIETFVKKQQLKCEEKMSKRKLVRWVYLVTDEMQNGRITALRDKTQLESRLNAFGIVVCEDKPTKPPGDGAIFEVAFALPDAESLENYIAMIMKHRKLPTRRNKWKDIYRICHDREEVCKRWGTLSPILDRPKKEGPPLAG